MSRPRYYREPPGELGVYLLHCRTIRGLSIRNVAKDVGVTPPFLDRLETGIEKRPPRIVLEALASHYGEPLETVLELAGVLPADLQGWIARDKDLIELLRAVKEKGITGAELREKFNGE